jgi:hypothetical protein
VQEVGLVALSVILGALAVAAAAAILWLAGTLAWGAFKDNFLSPALEIVPWMRRRKPSR